MTPLTSVSGLASGIDFQGLADAIIAARRAPLRAIQKQITGSEQRSQAYLSLESRLRGLQEAARSLESGGGTLVRKVASITVPGGEKAGFTASAGNDAALAAHDITVLELANRERLGGGEFASRDDALGFAGTFLLNGVEVTVEAGDSLDAVVERINEAGGEGAGVRASVVKVDEGVHRLVLSSLEEGAQGIDPVDGGGVLENLGILDAGGDKREVLEAGRDARIRVDGVEVTRSRNQVDDVLDGITLTLVRADPEATAQMEVSQSTEDLRKAIEALAEAYNGVARFAREQVATGDGTRPPLSGDSVLRGVAGALQAAMLEVRPGADEEGPRRLGDLGVTLQRDGTFSVDRTRLDAALAANPQGVARLFELTSTSSEPAVSLLRVGAETEAGEYRVEITAAASQAVAEGTTVDPILSGVAEGDHVRIASLTGTREVVLAVEEGMTLDDLALRLTEALAEEGMDAEVTTDAGRLQVRHLEMGSSRGFLLDLEGNAAVLTGLVGGEYRGTDVEGTVDGEAATGTGAVLTATRDGTARGLALLVEGIPAGGEAFVSFARGVGAEVQRLAGRATGGGSSSLQAAQDRLSEGADRLRARAESLEVRLERQREALNRRFAAVEEAISKAQSQGLYLGSQLDQIGRFQYGPRRR